MTSSTSPGQDGEERQSLAEILGVDPEARAGKLREEFTRISDAERAAYLPDLVRAERDRVRKECAGELRRLIEAKETLTDSEIGEDFHFVESAPLRSLAASWSTPDPASSS